MDITNMTVEQLKALAYDQIAIASNAQKNIQAIEAEIAKKQTPVGDPKVKKGEVVK